MAKMSLTSLLDGSQTAEPTEGTKSTIADSRPATPDTAPVHEPALPIRTADPAPQETEVARRMPADEPESGPRYLKFERKETRLSLGQLDELTELRRRLNKKRQGRGERLTENTLIRIAVDLLLANANKLDGATEPELRKSVGL